MIRHSFSLLHFHKTVIHIMIWSHTSFFVAPPNAFLTWQIDILTVMCDSFFWCYKGMFIPLLVIFMVFFIDFHASEDDWYIVLSIFLHIYFFLTVCLDLTNSAVVAKVFFLVHSCLFFYNFLNNFSFKISLRIFKTSHMQQHVNLLLNVPSEFSIFLSATNNVFL